MKGVDFKQSFDGEVAQLEIREAFPEDRGTYSCLAKLGSAEARTECKLTITGINQVFLVSLLAISKSLESILVFDI